MELLPFIWNVSRYYSSSDFSSFRFCMPSSLPNNLDVILIPKLNTLGKTYFLSSSFSELRPCLTSQSSLNLSSAFHFPNESYIV